MTVTADLSGPAIVALGASAGGLEALQAFFAQIPPHTGACYIVIQHLSPDFHSLMDELLGRVTRMPVSVVRDGDPIEADRVYLIPADANLVTSGDRLQLVSRSRRAGGMPNYPVDLFFTSMAQRHRGRLVGIILSGSGSDGTMGVRAVNEAGGLVFAQDPKSAKFDGMPTSAIQTGLADVVGEPGQLAQRIVALLGPDAPRPARGQVDEGSEALGRVIALLQHHHDLDLEGYKTATLLRRIERRAQLTQASSLADYVDRVEGDLLELERLLTDLLISVTSFFRDRDAWRLLADSVFPRLVEELRAVDGELRLWSCACSTGEEAYSLAMLTVEAFEAVGRPVNARIFATDIGQRSLDHAAAGVYPVAIRDAVGAARCARFFDLVDGHYRVKPELRRLVVFAAHDVTRQTPFSRMHLVSCRNMLIYLEPPLQQRVIHRLHYALRMGGVLFLGNAEGPLEMAEFSTPESGDSHIFRKIRRSPPLTHIAGVARRAAATRMPNTEWIEGPAPFRSTDGVLEPVLTSLLAESDGFGVVINRSNAVLHVIGPTPPWFRPRSGAFNNEVSSLLPRRLGLSVVTGLHRARSGQGSVRFGGVHFDSDGSPFVLDLLVIPASAGAVGPEVDYVIFTPAPPDEAPAPSQAQYDAGAASSSRIQLLENELQQTRENLQATIEELEATSEQQQAGNEELLASNEELQSTNEELHSVNEELHTVNAEYQAKIHELTSLTSDLDGLLNALEVGVLFLDQDLAIRRFNRRALSAFRLDRVDIGRPLSDIADNLFDEQARLAFYGALAAGDTWHATVDVGGRSLRVRCAPLGARDGRDGRLVTLVDVHDVEAARRLAAHREATLRGVNDQVPVVLFRMGAGGRYEYLSPAYEALWDLRVEDAMQDPGLWVERVHPEDRERVVEGMAEGKAAGGFDLSYRVVHRDGTTLWLRAHGARQAASGETVGVIIDVTEQVAAQAELKGLVAQIQGLIRSTGSVVYDHDVLGLSIAWSGDLQGVFGLDADALGVGEASWRGRVHPDDVTRVEAALQRAAAAQHLFDLRYRFRHADGHYLPVHDRGEVYVNGAGELVRVVGIMHDLSERVDLERARARLMLPAVEPRLAWTFDPAASPPLSYAASEAPALAAVIEAEWLRLLDRLANAPASGAPFALPLGEDTGHPCVLEGCPVPGQDGVLVGIVRFAEGARLALDVIEHLPARLTVRDGKDRVVLANAAARRWLGQPAEGGPLVAPIEVAEQHDCDRESVLLARRRQVQIHDSDWHQTSPIRATGWFDAWFLPLPGPPPSRLLALHTDVSERHEEDDAARRRESLDALTGLLKRDVFVGRLQHAIERSRRSTEPAFALLFMDLDGFKEVNDSYGHHVGDTLLRAFGDRIDGVCRPGDSVARFGGDEFAMLVERVSDYRDALAVAGRIHEAVREPVSCDGRRLFITTSIGIALYDVERGGASAVLRDADVAMYAAKVQGPGQTAVFDARMHADVLRRLETKNDLRAAVERGELRVFAQPIFDAVAGRGLLGAELLVRWQHPTRGLLSPIEFLPMARQAGLLAQVEEVVLYRALDWAAQIGEVWRGAAAFKLCVNLGEGAMHAKWLPDWLDAVQALQAAHPVQMVVEVTEETLLGRGVAPDQLFDAIHARGALVAVDDFGTGYSSLSYLFRFSVDILKVDRSFLEAAHRDLRTSQVVEAIVLLCQRLGVSVFLEGIEEEKQLAYARTLNVDGVQGFLVGRPKPVGDLLDTLCGEHGGGVDQGEPG